MPTLKEDAIKMTKSTLVQIPFYTVYSYADNLFDKKNELSLGSLEIEKEVNFLKQTKLGDLAFEDTDQAYFTMKNSKTNESIKVSNRASTRGELRGEVLRHVIATAATNKPDLTVYDLISSVIKMPKYSDVICMAQAALTGEMAEMIYGKRMSKEHFALFTRTFLNKINERIATGHQPPVEPKDIRNDQRLQEKICSGIDLASIYDATFELQKYFQQIKEKADLLKESGHVRANIIVVEFYESLITQQNNFIEGKITSKEFASNCTRLVNNAENGELGEYQSFFGTIYHDILTALNTINLGVAPANYSMGALLPKGIFTFFQSVYETAIAPTLEEDEEKSTNSINNFS